MKRALALTFITSLVALLAAPALHAEEIASVNTNFRFTGSDRVTVEAYDDPAVAGVTCYVSRARTGGPARGRSDGLRVGRRGSHPLIAAEAAGNRGPRGCPGSPEKCRLSAPRPLTLSVRESCPSGRLFQRVGHSSPLDLSRWVCARRCDRPKSLRADRPAHS